MSPLHALTHRKRNLGLVAALRVLWVLAIAWNELGTFYWHVRRCAWPDGFLVRPSSRPALPYLPAQPQRPLGPLPGVPCPISRKMYAC